MNAPKMPKRETGRPTLEARAAPAGIVTPDWVKHAVFYEARQWLPPLGPQDFPVGSPAAMDHRHAGLAQGAYRAAPIPARPPHR
jgi:hypothetical protein